MLRRALSATHVEQLKPSSGTCRLLPKRLGKHSKCGAHFSDEDIRANNTVGACLFASYQGRLLCDGSWSRLSWRM